MPNIIRPKRSNTASKVPNTTELTSGELGVNMADRKVYINNGTAVVQVGAGNLSGLGDVVITTPSNNQTLVYNSTTSQWNNATAGAGTVTSVATGSGLTGGPITTSGTISLATAYGDTVNPYASKTANNFLAAPNGAAGVPTFRAIVSADIPTLNQNTTGSSGSCTGNAATATNVAYSGLTGTVPTWNQNTTGNAGNVTGIVAVVNGGTGANSAASARTNLGATTLGGNLYTLANVAAIAFPRFNADNTVSSLDAATFRTAIGAGTSSTNGTVTSVGGTGTVSGLSLSGTVTTSGNLTLGGTLAVTPSNFASQTAKTVLAAPNGAAGVPTFRTLVAADIPALPYGTGTVTSVATSGTVSGLTLTGGTITTTGTITLGGTLAVTPSNFASQTANTFLAAPNGAAGVPTFRAVVAADIPTLNQNTTGIAANVTGTVAVANGGTGAGTAATARTNLGASTVGGNLFTLTNPSAVTFPRFNADNTVSSLDAASFRTAIGAGTSSTTGTVTSVGGTGAVSGLTLTGTVTTSGNLTLGGTLAVTPSNFASQTANTFLAAPNGAAGVPTFRAMVAADVPTLNQNTTGSAATLTTARTIQTNLASTSSASFNGSANITPGVTGTLPIGNGGTNATTAAAARTNLGAMQNDAPAFHATFTGTSVFAVTNAEMGTSTKTFDTASAFSTTTGRFTPQVAGYYQINASVSAGPSGVGGMGVQILKNSSGTINNAFFGTGDTTQYKAIATSGVVFLNGSTDYVSVYTYVASGSMTATGYFSGAMIRSNA